MEIKDFDYLSNKISIYYNERERHSSIIGRILTIIMVALSISYVLYLIIGIFTHKFSDYISYKTYLKDAGYFPFTNNKTGIFHYFELFDVNNNQFEEFNTKYARIFMTRIYNGYKNNYLNLNDNEHWVYDKCRKGIDDKNIPQNIFNDKSDIKNDACLRYYYNNKEKKYYSIDDKENFILPSLIHGSGTNDFLYLNTIVEKCHNDSLLYEIFGPCGTENEINNYFDNLGGIYMQLLEQQIDTKNYSNPIFYYLNSLSGDMDNSDVPINNINLSPFKIEIKTGVIYPVIKKIYTYALSFNRKTLWYNSINNNIVAVFNFWLTNTAEIFKGGYKTVYDLFPNVGGILQLSYYIFYTINYLMNKYIILNDSKKLFFYIKDHNQDIKDEEEKKKFINILAALRGKIIGKERITMEKKSIMFNNIEQQKNIKRFKNKSSSFLIKDKQNPDNTISKIKINNNNDLTISLFNRINNNSNNPLFANDNKSNEFNVSNVKNNSSLLNSQDFNNKMTALRRISDNYLNSAKSQILEKYNDEYNYMIFSQNIYKFISEKKNKIKLELISPQYLEKYSSIRYYLLSLFTFGTKRGKTFYIINKFRKKLISEEHIFKSHIYLYYLEKYFDINKSEKIDIAELYNYL